MSDDFQMKFVTPKDGETDPALLEAFNLLREHGITPEWLSHDQCLEVEAADKNCAYVIDPFEGLAFEHLKLLACRVYGAQCILSSLNMKVELPQKKRPIYNVAMKGVTVCCTSLDRPTRDHVHHLVEMMAGEASKNLMTEVTHIVAGEVGSQKYTVAASRGTPIMTVDWVNTVWETAQHRYVHGTDSQFAKLRCPVFKGLVVTVSGLTPAEREKVKHDVENEGGTYTGEMKMNECTHLIVKEPKGQKYNFACKWKIHIVTLRWLYESLDKNYCQDEKQYPVTGGENSSGVKTSTPEKSRRSAIKPDIADISVISINSTHIDETALAQTRLGTESFDCLDLSCVAKGEHFIDSCRLYLSAGIRGAVLEKCKKIINIGGATRLNEINENITHVIMEDKVDNEINAVNNMDLRPHVVNALWLAECFKQGRHVSEEAFLSPHLPFSELELPKLQVSGRKSVVEKRKGSEAGKPRDAPSSSATSSSFTTAKGGDKDDGDMVHLLSQYMDESSGQGETTVQPMDEVDGNASSSTVRQAGDGDETTRDYEADDATQDPDSEVTTAEVTGVFGGKTFVFYGFSEEDVAALTDLVIQAGGVCLKESRRKVPDYAIVPLFGCPVKQTVGEVVTNAWLQMCIEAEELLCVGDHAIFQPMDLNEETRPLEGCVLSVSGYQGVERDCLTHIADALGAVCQEYFVRKANKSLQASTHLIVREPSGQKYNAAKKWNLPTVTKEWLLACARSGQREDEEKFNIDNVNSDSPDSKLIPQQQQQSATTPSAQPAAAAHHQQHSSGSGMENSTTPQKAEDCTAPSGPYSKVVLQQEETDGRSHDFTKETKAQESKDCSTPSKEAGQPSPLCKPIILQQEEIKGSHSKVVRKDSTSGMARSGEAAESGSHSKPTSLQREISGTNSKPFRKTSIICADKTLMEVQVKPDAASKLSAEMAPPSSSAESARSNPSGSADRVSESSVSDMDVNNPMSSAKAMVQHQQKGSQLSQKENLTAVINAAGNLITPTRHKKPANSRIEVLQQQSRKPFLSPGVDSPSVFMAPGYKPNFDLKDVFEYLKTPEGQSKKNETESPSLEELFKYHIAKGIENSSVPQNMASDLASSQSSQSEEPAPLAGVIISVGKKLGVNQTEYNSIVVELGGDYMWQYSASCTHFIFQGRANDLNKEYRLAKSQGKTIVSPHWLYACLDKRCRVDEAMYPHTFNPNMNLGGVVRTETPVRSLRSGRSNRSTPNQAQAESTNLRTPVRLGINPTTPAKAAAWQRSMEEMKTWQADSPSHAAGSGECSSAKKRLGTVVEVTSPKKLSPKAGEKVPVPEDVKTRASSSSSLSSNDDKSVGTKCEAEIEKSAGNAESEACPSDPLVTEVAQECGGSLEIREALSKTLEKVKASSSRSKKSSKRRNRRTDPNSSGDQTNLSGNLPDAASHHASPWETRHHAQDVGHTTESLGVEASQSVQITWDDPTGRREKEKLAHKLDMVCGPSQNTQNTEDFMANVDMPDVTTSPPSPKQQQATAHEPVRSPTPEPPPLAFPTAKNVARVSSPQPVELLSEESNEDSVERTIKPVILTSGMGPQERIEYAEVIERLGGTVLEKQQFDPACTHVVVIKPTRNEKFLAAVATGRWVLHKSYLIACRQEGRFVREDDHEWGNPAMSHLMQSLDTQTFNLVQAAYKWRQKVHSMRKTDPGCKGAFQGWRAILLTEPKREDNFRRLLMAGGATVITDKPPFSEISATHAFVELHKVKLSDTDLQALVRGVDHILRPEFIAAHLTEKEPVPDNYTPAEIASLKLRLQTERCRKRKSAQSENVGGPSKHSRR